MSATTVSALIGALVVVPACFAVLLFAAGGIDRLQKALAVAYAAVTGTLALLLLGGFLDLGEPVGWGALNVSWLSLIPVTVLTLTSVPALLYAAYSERPEFERRVSCALIPASCSLAVSAFMVEGIAGFAVLWVAASACALAALAAGGMTGLRSRLASFIPWILSDLLLVTAAALTAAWLKEGVLLVDPPVTAGGEVHVIIVSLMLLVAAGIRLGLFPVGFWTGRLMRSAAPSWNAWFLGAMNFLMSGFLLVVAVTLAARLVAYDWSAALAVVGLLTVLAGPIIALRDGRLTGVLSGFYSMQGGVLLLALSSYSRAGIEGALFNIAVSPIFLAAALMAAGEVVEVAGTGELGKKRIPVLAAPAAFTGMLVAGMSICGLPPLDGFFGKAAAVAGSLDASAVRGGLFALAAAGVMAAAAIAVAALVRAVAGAFFTGEGPRAGIPVRGGYSRLVRNAAMISMCAASVLFGVFPGVFIRNVAGRASVALFPRGFSGPGVVFKGTGEAAARALDHYASWAQEPAAFLVAVAALAAAAYFVNRSRLRRREAGARALDGGN